MCKFGFYFLDWKLASESLIRKDASNGAGSKYRKGVIPFQVDFFHQADQFAMIISSSPDTRIYKSSAVNLLEGLPRLWLRYLWGSSFYEITESVEMSTCEDVD